MKKIRCFNWCLLLCVLFQSQICVGNSCLREIQRESQKVSSQVSYLNICAFSQDSMGYMWIATLHGLNRYNGHEFFQYHHDERDSTSLDNDFVFSLYLDSYHRLWVGTALGVNRYDFKTNRFVRYPSETGDSNGAYSFYEDHNRQIWFATPSGPGRIDTMNNIVRVELLRQNRVVNLFWEDSSDRLWMGMKEESGLAVLNAKSQWEHIELPGKRHVSSIYKDVKGIWWLGTNSGLILFDPASRKFKAPPEACLRDSKLNNAQINFILEVSPLKLWIGTDSEGMFQYDILSQTLKSSEVAGLNDLDSNQLLTGYVDRQNNVWIGSYDKGFSVWNSSLDYFNADYRLSELLRDKFVTRIVEDTYGNLWIGTRYDGLFHYTVDGMVTVYNAANSDLFLENVTPIESLFIDSGNNIWIGLAKETIVGTFSSRGDLKIREKKKLAQVRSMKEDKMGNLWFGTVEGLYKLGREDKELHEIYRFNIPDLCILRSGDILFSSYGQGVFRLGATDTIPQRLEIPDKMAASLAARCVTLTEDSQERIWLGSYGNGMLCMSADRYDVFNIKNGFSSNYVLDFQESQHGYMWVSTSAGISKIKHDDLSEIVNYSLSDGTLGNQYHEKAGLTHSDGRIFFGGNHGLTFFNPIAPAPKKIRPVIHLEDLKVLNHNIQPHQNYIALPLSIAYADEIILNHKQSIFTIDYTGIDFLDPNGLSYAYKLEGLDTDWNYVGDFRRATYSNLNSGKYVFYVKAINSDGLESVRPASIRITVKSAPWFTWQAWTFYTILFITVVGFIFYLWFKARMDRQLLAIEHSERERGQEITEMKINFFTNISHELRTPLTLIAAPLEQLMSQTKPDDLHARLLNTISRNVQSMLRLINQLLDFRKMENGMLSLQVRQIDFVQFFMSVQDKFTFLSVAKQVELLFAPHVDQISLWIDTDKLEKIVHNLLSNALKHTPDRGRIVISTREISYLEACEKYPEMEQLHKGYYVEVVVSDSGSGIPEDKMDELFVRYRQISGPLGYKPDYGGSGIGLHYTKRLVETHYGRICANIQPEGGMAFSIILPMEDVYSESEKGGTESNIATSKNNEIPIVVQEESIIPQDHPYTILVAEDNVELMYFIRNLLGSKYNLLESPDGDKAWTLAQSESPDLILSDVLMPGLSGYELCAQVKNHPALSHIPVILLTAKSTIPEQLEGLEQGADAYISKPFHVDHVLITIKNLIMTRERLREYYSTPQLSGESPIAVSLNSHDQIFVDKLISLLNQELSNSELNIDYLAREMAFSRTGFYRKVKGLTDMAPNDFIKNYRLKRAAEILAENQLSLRDVAEQTGFSSYSYFSKSFKKHYGTAPKEYNRSANLLTNGAQD